MASRYEESAIARTSDQSCPNMSPKTPELSFMIHVMKKQLIVRRNMDLVQNTNSITILTICYAYLILYFLYNRVFYCLVIWNDLYNLSSFQSSVIVQLVSVHPVLLNIVANLLSENKVIMLILTSCKNKDSGVIWLCTKL